MKELLEVLRVQRHDFMNHLQIISGMVQLNKTDRVFGYIQELSRVMSEEGKITALTVPEAAAALLINRQQAAGQGVELRFNITANLAGCQLTGPELAEIINGILSEAVVETVGSNCISGEVFVDINDNGDVFLLLVSFVCGREKYTGPPEILGELCRKHGAEISCSWAAEDKVQLRVELPKIKP